MVKVLCIVVVLFSILISDTIILFVVVCLCVCLSAVVAALVANKDIYIVLLYYELALCLNLPVNCE